ncbi:MAG: wax ester/triacylglycerol synthase family O-acyltransferase [Deltaproteobacteria bacterium]|nr:MAG: wax ester/triacylglycerol synthase family O-acyltransferase [Deltaproteobacteria bacterium]
MGTYERLSAQDATFLYAESPVAHMHIGTLAIFEDTGLDEQGLAAHIESRLHLVPRFRKKLMWVPYGQGRPVWVDDPHFDIRFHVRHTGLPKPGGMAEAIRLMERLMSTPLDRSRPLWEIWMVDLPEGRKGLIQKTHHCLIDGVSGVDLGTVILDVMKDPPPSKPPPPWEPQPPPSKQELLRDSLIETFTRPAELAAKVRQMREAPQQFVERAAEVVQGLLSFGKATMDFAPKVSSLTRPIGPHRRFIPLTAPLATFKHIKRAFECKINDVVLAVVAGGLRRLLVERGESVDDLHLRALVPVSVRDPSQRMTYGNQVSMMAADLPVGEPDPVQRLKYVTAQMTGLKESRQAVGADFWVKLSEYAPPTVLALAGRAIALQRMVNLTVTNVPGPQFPLYLRGGKLLAAYPFVPLVGTTTLGVALVSYDGGLHFGLCGDWDGVPDLDVFARGIEQSIAELREAADAQ